jgi:uncharacterized membrane protein
MSLFALLLVLSAAGLHAGWNLLAKRVGGGAAFVWLNGVCATILYAPLAAFVWLTPGTEVSPMSLVFMAGSALLHTVYFVSLQQGYRVGDLSLVYPLARGSGPLLATLGAIALLGERPSPLALFGAVLITGGVFTLTGGQRLLALLRMDAGGPTQQAIVYGLRTGAVIALYTLWDKQAVSAVLVPPLLLDWGANFGRAALLTPLALRRWPEVCRLWRVHRWAILGVAVLTPLAYILVLTAMTFTPVSYIAPAREISILAGAAMGARLLKEGDVRRRLSGAGAMVAGVVALALG